MIIEQIDFPAEAHKQQQQTTNDLS